MNNYSYEGSELDLFAQAKNWKRYFARILKPYIRGHVLEVGAGMGATTAYLCEQVQRWTCLEPDANLAEQCRKQVQHLHPRPEVITSNLERIDTGSRFDCILYIDVLEHIRENAREMKLACEHLNANGTMIVLSPAHPFLFSAFDQAIGHHRRYNRKSFSKIAPPELELVKMFYLDSAGLLASLGNKWILKNPLPTQRQILFWDRALVTLSKYLDFLLGYQLGKTIVGIWRKKS
ncbi:MAG: class I SAM-dependent methyltransferase [Verrucomicrobiota bacterium]